MHQSLEILRTKQFAVMGIVNVTPDSFSDGGRYSTTEAAVNQAKKLIDDGADIIDIGGESTRPGAQMVSADQELKRVIPVIEKLRISNPDIPISIDTTKAAVAQNALDAGAAWINDISAGRFDEKMGSVVAQRKCPVVLMHSRKTPQTMQHSPQYHDVVEEVQNELMQSIENFTILGVQKENIIIDPGIGFAKRIEDNLLLIKKLKKLAQLGHLICIGTSRKSFIGHITGKEVSQRCAGTLGSIAAAFLHGAFIFRVHDVAETKDFLTVFTSIENA